MKLNEKCSVCGHNLCLTKKGNKLCFSCIRGNSISKSKRMSKDEYIKKASLVHNYIYKYDLASFNNLHDKIKIICSKHGVFEQEANNHLRGEGCPLCAKESKKSKGCQTIEKFLNENKIEFLTEYTFENCVGVRNKLPFDYYLPKYNILIEYDGEQHYKPKFHQTKEEFTKQKENDKIKNEFCKKEGIKLIRISYKEKNIPQLLEEALNDSSNL